MHTHIYTHIRIHIHTHTHMHTHIHKKYTHKYTHTHTYIQIYTQTHIGTHTYKSKTQSYIHTHTHIYIHKHNIYIHKHTHMHTHIHAYTHTYTPGPQEAKFNQYGLNASMFLKYKMWFVCIHIILQLASYTDLFSYVSKNLLHLSRGYSTHTVVTINYFHCLNHWP